MGSKQHPRDPEPSLERRGTEPAGPPLPQYGLEHEHIPSQVGPYRILDLLACSRMALVYKAEQAAPQRIVALKMPRGGRLVLPETRERFKREIELAALVAHAGVVPVLEAGEIDGTPFYTMQFIEGRSLQDFVALERPTLERRLQVFLRLCEILKALHERDLIHRDLKPENVMVDRHGDVRLLDFGLAKAEAETSARLTADNAILGTRQFMAPEQTLPGSERRFSPAADVYSLGVMLFWLLTDQMPYAVDGPPDAALQTIRHGSVDPPSQKRPALGTRYDQVVMDCLKKDPGARPENAGRLGLRLRQAIQSEPALVEPQLTPAGPGQIPVAALESESVRIGVRAVIERRPRNFRVLQEERTLKLPGFPQERCIMKYAPGMSMQYSFG